MRIAILAAVLLLAGCATEVRLPVTGRVGGEPAFGYINVQFGGNTDYVIDTAKGLSCRATVPTGSGAGTNTMNGTCNDGRALDVTGKKLDGRLGGIAAGSLSDGTKAQFVYGKDIRYEEEFPGPDATAPAKPAPATKRR